jgi:hypothetical protein
LRLFGDVELGAGGVLADVVRVKVEAQHVTLAGHGLDEVAQLQVAVSRHDGRDLRSSAEAE